MNFVELDQFYKACNPSKTLMIGDPHDRQYYIDFASVRGGKIIEALQRTISKISPFEPTCQLFTGHIGCGKSTELFRLKAELEQEDFYVVYIESSQDLDMADVDVSDILLGIARQVSESLESAQIRLRPGYFANLFAEISELLKTDIDISACAELSLGIAKITAKTKDSPNLRSQLRQYLEPRTSTILQAINQEVLGRANEELRLKGYKGLVVIIDNLDRLDATIKGSGRTQPEYLFVDRGEQLKTLNCHLVYTIPLTLIFSNDFGRLASRFGIKPKVLPMVPIQLRSGEDCQEGMSLLRQLVLARAFPHLSDGERLKLVIKLVEHPETLNRLCRISGGHVRNLLVLLYSCLQHEDPPFSVSCVESVIQEYRDDLLAAITADEWQLLFQVVQRQSVTGEEECQTLLRSMFVFEYRDQEGRWFGINPALLETRPYQEWSAKITD